MISQNKKISFNVMELKYGDLVIRPAHNRIAPSEHFGEEESVSKKKKSKAISAPARLFTFVGCQPYESGLTGDVKKLVSQVCYNELYSFLEKSDPECDPEKLIRFVEICLATEDMKLIRIGPISCATKTDPEDGSESLLVGWIP